eukprot:superscaffoldBa00002622_g14826
MLTYTREELLEYRVHMGAPPPDILAELRSRQSEKRAGVKKRERWQRNRRKRAFMAGDREKVRSIQKELRRELRRAKNSYKARLESKLQLNNTKEVRRGVKGITGLNSSGPAVEGGHELNNELNLYFNRFDSTPTIRTSAGHVSTNIPIHKPSAPIHTSVAVLPFSSPCPTTAAAEDSAGGSTAPSHFNTPPNRDDLTTNTY